MKRTLLILALAAFLLAGCSSDGGLLTGQVTHPTYSAFSDPESRFVVVGSQFSVTDTAVYKTGWYSVNGAAWQQFTLSGSAYGASSSWLSGTSSYALPAALSAPGEHYVIVYSCSRSGSSWNCHGNTGNPSGAWQLQVITVASSAPGCDDGLQDGDETGVDCGGSCGSSCPKYSRVFYVSNSVGNDVWTGRIPEPNGTDGPWKTVVRVNHHPFLPGDVILFKRGDTWVVERVGGTGVNYDDYSQLLVMDRSGTAGNPITYGAYDVGPKPIITGRQSVPGWNVPSNWVLVGGNVWRYTNGLPSTINIYTSYSSRTGLYDRGRLWLDGVEAQKAKSPTLPTPTLPWTHEGNTLYVYATENPALQYADIECVGVLSQVVLVNQDHITFQDLDLRGGGNVLVLQGTKDIIVQRCSIGWDSGGSGLWGTSAGGRTCDNLVIRDNMFDTNDHAMDNFSLNNAEDGLLLAEGGDNWDIYNNTFRNWAHIGADLGTFTDTPVTNMRFHHNTISAPDIDYGHAFSFGNKATTFGRCTGNEIHDNYFYDYPTQIELNGDGFRFYNNIIDGVRGSAYTRPDADLRRRDAEGLAFGTFLGYPANIEIHNNIIMNCRDAGIYFAYGGTSPPQIYQNNSFRNNIIYNCGYGPASVRPYAIAMEWSPGVMKSNTYHNNIIYTPGKSLIIFNGKIKDQGAVYQSVAEFNAMDGLTVGMWGAADAPYYVAEVADSIGENIGGDSLFVDATNPEYLLRDYHLRAGSPAIDAGVEVGSPYSGSAPDIGPFEYTSPADCGCEEGYYCSQGACLLNVTGRTFFVSLSGNDDDSGNLSHPWRTWTKAFHTARPGDLVYFRGGVYPTEVTDGTGIRYIPAQGLGFDGLADRYIRYFNYPGEIPVLDCAESAATHDGIFNKGMVFTGVDYVHVKGLHVKNVYQRVRSGPWDIAYGIWSDYSDHLRFEQVVVSQVMGPGFNSENEHYIEFINCDSHDNIDYYSARPGDYGQGWHGSGEIITDGYKYFYGCRAWGCADQGISASGPLNHVVIERFWSFENGVDLLGSDGHGFKIGYWDTAEPSIDPLVEYRNCIAANNKGDGFSGNEHLDTYTGAYKIYNSFSYNNSRFGFVLNPTSSLDEQELKRTLRNNIVYLSGIVNVNAEGAYTHSNNSWDGPVIVDADDFESLDGAQLRRPRKADGSLPDITFGRLQENSDLIDRGINVGLPFIGPAPDLGPFEYQG